jgi:hypothetical protein
MPTSKKRTAQRASSKQQLAKTNGSRPRKFALTEAQRLELENIQLKQQLAQQQMQTWGVKVQAHHGLELTDYSIDVATGQCTLKPSA